MRLGPRLVGPLHASVVDTPCGKKMCSGLRRAEPVSHTVKPLNVGVSTHRWARDAERAHGGAAPRLPVLHRSCATQRSERGEEKGAHNGTIVAHRRLAARFSHCGVRERKGSEAERMSARVQRGTPGARFCSTRNRALSSDQNERSTSIGP
jgi:hypothetical protein